MVRAPRAIAASAALLIVASARIASSATDPDVTSAVVEASPDTPIFAAGWRSDGGGETRGSLGAAIPVLPDAWGAFVTVAPLVELHNDPGSSMILPNENWRGRLSIAAGTTMDPRSTIALAFEHESDHASSRTGSVDAVLHTHDFDVKIRRTDPIGQAALLLGVDARLYIDSCTRLDAGCHGFSGSTSIGAAAAATYDGDPHRVHDISPFASIEGMFIVPHDPVLQELRVVAAGGIVFDAARSRWAILVDGWLGNDVGIERHREITALGLALRWVP